MKKFLGFSVVAVAFALSVSFASAANYSIMPSLTMGSTGPEVVKLQEMLIAKGNLVLPAGVNKGYFGTLTKNALAAFQVANGISPAVGYYGSVTAAKVNAMAMGGTTGGNTSGNTSGSLSGEEASIESLEAKDGVDDEVEEGGKAEIAEFEFDVEDGDVRIERVDLTFTTAAAGNEENEPWKTFETITIMDEDGKELASEDVSDEDDWLDEDSPYSYRFNGLDYLVKEGDTGKIVVEFEANNSIDSASTDIPWTVYIATDGLRGTDGSGIEQYEGDSTETVTFNVTEEGGNDDLSVRSSKKDPDSTTLMVEDNTRSDYYTIFSFELDSDEESGDIEIDQLPIVFTTNDLVGDVINDLEIVIDGETFDDYTLSSSTTAVATTTFDINKDYSVPGGERVTVEVRAQFKAQSGNYAATSTTIQATVIGAEIDAEGADSVAVTGTVDGETHTLSLSDVTIDNFSWTVDATGSFIDFNFTVEANDESFDVLTSSIASSTAGTATTSAGVLAKISGDTPTTISGGFRVEDGDSTTFRVRYSITGANGTYAEVTITEVAGQEIPDAKEKSPTAVKNVN